MMLNSSLSRAIFAIAAAAFTAAGVQAGVTFYSTANSFGAAQPTAAAVSFAGLGPAQPYVHANPLVLPGVTFTTLNPGLAASALIVFDDSVGNNWFGDTVAMSFGAGTTAVGADIFNQIGETGSSPQTAPITERVYSGAILLGAREINEASGFFGVSSTTAITEVTFFSDCSNDCSTFVDTVSLVGASAPPSAPEPGSWVLMLLGFCGLGATTRTLRRRRLAKPEL